MIEIIKLNFNYNPKFQLTRVHFYDLAGGHHDTVMARRCLYDTVETHDGREKACGGHDPAAVSATQNASVVLVSDDGRNSKFLPCLLARVEI